MLTRDVPTALLFRARPTSPFLWYRAKLVGDPVAKFPGTGQNLFAQQNGQRRLLADPLGVPFQFWYSGWPHLSCPAPFRCSSSPR